MRISHPQKHSVLTYTPWCKANPVSKELIQVHTSFPQKKEPYYGQIHLPWEQKIGLQQWKTVMLKSSLNSLKYEGFKKKKKKEMQSF